MRAAKNTVSVEVIDRWIRLRLPRQPFGGQQKYIRLGLKDCKQNQLIAQAIAKQIESDIVFGRLDPSLQRYRIPTYIEEIEVLPSIGELWDSYTEFKRPFLAKNSLRDFRRVRNHIASLPTQKLTDARKIRDWLYGHLTPDAAYRCLQQVRACCNWAVAEEKISLNPFERLTIPVPQRDKNINPFSNSERDLIIQAFEDHPDHCRYTALVKFYFLTGCRSNEAAELQWKHIDPDLTTIAFLKTKKRQTRKFPINQQLKEVLLAIMHEPSPEDFVFRSPEGMRLDCHNFLNRVWRDVLAGLPQITYRPQYNTRHTFITLCLEKKIPVQQVAEWVGNSPRTIWSNYAGIVNLASVPIL